MIECDCWFDTDDSDDASGDDDCGCFTIIGDIFRCCCCCWCSWGWYWCDWEGWGGIAASNDEEDDDDDDDDDVTAVTCKPLDSISCKMHR